MRKFNMENKKEITPDILKIQEEVKAIIRKFGAIVAKTRKDKEEITGTFPEIWS